MLVNAVLEGNVDSALLYHSLFNSLLTRDPNRKSYFRILELLTVRVHTMRDGVQYRYQLWVLSDVR